MNQQEVRVRLLLSIEWVCQTLWLAQRREPELLQLQEERGSTGFPHYIASRAGNVPDRDWAPALYVLPQSLVDHLRPRCLALEPASYFAAALDAGAAALRRLRPGASGASLGELARAARPEGELPRAWWELPPRRDPHHTLLWAAMTLREGRAYAHYQAAAAQGLRPLELLLVTSAWQGSDGVPVERFFRWGEDEVTAARAALQAGGWLDSQGGLSGAGKVRRDAMEAQLDAHTDRLLDPLSDRQLGLLIAELPRPA